MFKDRSTAGTFQYQKGTNTKNKKNARQTNTAPKPRLGGLSPAADHLSPSPQKGRVRVQAGAGDKCVPPAKSRPKKRKAVPGSTDNSLLSMACVEWSDKRLSVNKLVQQYADLFPVIVKVTQGYYGQAGIELSTDQVLQVHSYGRQTRVIATDSTSRKVSIPLDYPLDVLVLDHREAERTRLNNVMRKHIPPFRVQVMSMSADLDINSVNLTGEELTIEDEKDEVYLRANSIIEGWIDQMDVVLIPAFLKAEFSVALGMHGASPEEWQDYKNMFSRSVRHLNFFLLQGHPGIVLLSPGDSSARSSFVSSPRSPTEIFIDTPIPEIESEPVHTPILENERGRRNTIDDPKTPVFPESSHEGENVYENFRQNANVTTVVLEPHPGPTTPDEDLPPLPPRMPIQRQSLGANAGVQTPPSVRSPAAVESRPETPFSEVDENDVEEMFNNVIRIGEEPQHLRSPQSPKSPPPTAEKPAPSPGSLMVTIGPQDPDRQAHTLEMARMDRPSRGEPPKVYAKNPLLNRADPLRQHHISSSDPRFRKGSLEHRKPDTNNNPSDEQEPSQGQFGSVHNLVGRLQEGLSGDQQGRNVASAYRSFNANAPRAVVQPRIQRHQSDHIAEAKVQHHGLMGKVGESSKIQTIEDVPENIENLTVEDVCQCLRLLNMDNHIYDFKRHQIDGRLLEDMKENTLTGEFRFTPFNASKLMRFTRGWRPKIL